MATALYFIDRATKAVGIKQAESPLEPFEVNDAFDVLQDMLSEWVASGVNLGFERVLNPAEEIRIPDGAYTAVWSNLGLRLAPDYQKPITQELAKTISDSTNAMLRAYQRKIRTRFPNTLPKGSGNHCDFDTFTQDRFFPGGEPENF